MKGLIELGEQLKKYLLQAQQTLVLLVDMILDLI